MKMFLFIGLLLFGFGWIAEKPEESIVNEGPPSPDVYQKVRGYNFDAKSEEDKWVYYDSAEWDTIGPFNSKGIERTELDKALEDAIEDYMFHQN